MNDCKLCGGLGVRIIAYEVPIMVVQLKSKEYQDWFIEYQQRPVWYSDDQPPHEIRHSTRIKQVKCDCQKVAVE